MRIRSFALLFAAGLVVFQAHSKDRTVYRCVLAGVTTFSDRPCGESIEFHSLDISDGPAPAAPSSTASRNLSELPPAAAKPLGASPAGSANSTDRKESRRRESRPEDSRNEDSRARTCARLDAELRRLRTRMRAGYGAAEGERLRERQRTASGRRRELRCR